MRKDTHMTKIVGGGGNLETFRSHATEVRVSSIGGGVWQILMLGPITRVSLNALRPSVLKACSGADALVLRMDQGILAMPIGDVIPAQTYDMYSPPGAIVCRADADEMALWNDYAEQVSASGATRSVFSSERLEWALVWARHQAQKKRVSRTLSTARILQAQARDLLRASHGLPLAPESADRAATCQTIAPARQPRRKALTTTR